MATNILGRELTRYGGSYSVDRSLLTLPNLPGEAAYIPQIVLDMALNFGQQISRFYGFNSQRVFLVAGRCQGQGNLNQILSPQAAYRKFHEVYGNVCNAKGNFLQFSLAQGCEVDGVQVNRFQAGMVVIATTAINGNSESAVVNNPVSFSFETLEYL